MPFPTYSGHIRLGVTGMLRFLWLRRASDIRPQYCLARAYVLPASTTSSIDLVDVADASTDGRAASASLNYLAPIVKEACRERVRHLAPESLESLLAFDAAEDQLVFSIGAAPREMPGCFEFVLAWPAAKTYGIAIEFFRRLERIAEVVYGYSDMLPADVSPLTEMRVRRGLFGTRTSVSKPRDSWLIPSRALDRGGLRGVYPVNYWCREVHNGLEELGFKFPQSLNNCTGLFEIDEPTLALVRELNPTFHSWIRTRSETSPSY